MFSYNNKNLKYYELYLIGQDSNAARYYTLIGVLLLSYKKAIINYHTWRLVLISKCS